MAVLPSDAPLDPPDQPDRPDVFISYSRADVAFVGSRLLDALVGCGKEVWIDLEDIPAAADWRGRIWDGIEAARAFVFILSPASIASQICAEELRRAAEANKRVIPVLWRDVSLELVPEVLERANWIFLRDDDDFDAQIERLVRALETDLDWVDQHARLAVRAREWSRSDGDRGRLLRGRDLQEAERWLADQASHQEAATAEHMRFIVASRHADRRRQRVVLGAVVAALAISLALTAVALVQRGQAVANEQESRSRELATRAVGGLGQSNVDIPALLSVEASHIDPTFEARNAGLTIIPKLERSRGVLTDAEGIMAVAPDGRTLATGDGNRVRLWDLTSRRPLGRPFIGHTNSIAALAFGPDGRTLASASFDDSVRLWDVRTRRPIGSPFAGDLSHVYDLAFSRDGKLLASAGDDGVVWVRNVQTHRLAGRQLFGHKGAITALAFSRDGKLLATAGIDKTARLWDFEARRPLGALKGHRLTVNDVAFSPDGRTLATAGFDRTVRLWDTANRRQIGRPLVGHKHDNIESVAFSPDGTTLASGGTDATVRLWDPTTRRTLGPPLTGHSEGVRDVAFSPDSKTVVSAAESVRLWDPRAGAGLTEPLVAHTDWVEAVAFDAGGGVLASAENGVIRLWDAETRRGLGGPLTGRGLGIKMSR